MPSFSAMFVRNIMPVCTWMPLSASSATITCGPIQRLVVASFGCALVGRPGTGEGVPEAGDGGAAGADLLQPPVKPARTPETVSSSNKRKVFIGQLNLGGRHAASFRSVLHYPLFTH